jgi:hypothetical protein
MDQSNKEQIATSLVFKFEIQSLSGKLESLIFMPQSIKICERMCSS